MALETQWWIASAGLWICVAAIIGLQAWKIVISRQDQKERERIYREYRAEIARIREQSA